LAARLFARIERSTGVSLPHGALLEHQTVEQLATLIRARRQGTGVHPPGPFFVVPIHAGGTRAPFFCVHGAGGNVLNLVALGRHLASDRPFYGVQARGLDGVEPPFSSIEQMADAYLAEIRAVQPRGPYFLGGYCGGGLVAYEMAQRLRATGERVALLALIDSPSPLLPPPESRIRRWSRMLREKDAGSILERARLKWRRDTGAARTAGALRFHKGRGGPIPHELRDQWLTNEFMQTAASYEIRPYSGELVLFRARDESVAGPANLGWGDLAAGGLRVEDVPGDHHSLAEEPHVRVLGTKLEVFLQRAESLSPEAISA
ncbi:MAG: alpha/beta fold hydrolase, partial [Deltaproteobacteria bacterium]